MWIMNPSRMSIHISTSVNSQMKNTLLIYLVIVSLYYIQYIIVDNDRCFSKSKEYKCYSLLYEACTRIK